MVCLHKIFSRITSLSFVLCIATAILLSSCGLPLAEPLPQADPIHGEDLLVLSDEQLFSTVISQTFDLVDSFSSEDAAFSKVAPACRVVYVLSIFDMELNNGGLCQFFVNPSRSVAPYVDECLETVGAEEHRQLLAEFVGSNQIDLQDLDSFRTFSIQGYAKQTERFDFASFDNAFYQFTPLQEYIVAYIKANISEF